MSVPRLFTIPCNDCGNVFQIMETRIGVSNHCHACKVKAGYDRTGVPSIERDKVIREIQAFASEYAHEMTKDGATRDVVIVEQLLEFLKSPSEPYVSTAQLDNLDRFHR